jgi:SAM-dependent methyltransferase
MTTAPSTTETTTDGTDSRSGSTVAAAAHADGHDWRVAGEAWGHAADDWSTLMEHYAVEVVAAIGQRCDIESGSRVLDMACGSGWAMRYFRGLGADVAGIDAADRLVGVAKERNPDSEVVYGSMFELPWNNGSFDAVTSINGIWGGCDDAVAEAHRVLKRGGMFGISFWGKGAPLDLRPFYLAVASHLDPDHLAGMVATNNIARPGVAEDMMRVAGFEVVERGQRISVVEWPDEDIAWRALCSVGPIVPALAHSDPAAVRRDALAAISHCRTERGTYRFENVQNFVIARKL